MARALYVEIDDYAAAWLRNLIADGVIAPGDVYCGDMRECRPQDLARYNQVHLFAGIGVWSYGLRRAGVPDSANIWTFSEPCQPFSAAGKGLGFADERYLRPYTHHLVTQCRPAICLGEQVASGDGLAWLDVVQSDMENANYAGGAIDTCSAGVGAPHIRQRLRFAYAAAERLADPAGELHHGIRSGGPGRRLEHSDGGFACSLADPDVDGLQGRPEQTLFGAGRRIEGDALGRGGGSLVVGLGITNSDRRETGRLTGPSARHGSPADAASGFGQLADTHGGRIGDGNPQSSGQQRLDAQNDGTVWGGRGGLGHNSVPELDRTGPTNGFWSDADWLYCRDDKWRPVEPGSFPLAHGLPRSIRTGGAGIQRLASLAGLDGASLARAKGYRTGSLKAYGNAVDAEATTEFCRAVAHTLGL